MYLTKMETKFVLNGGYTPGDVSVGGSDFYKEILKDAPENARILLVTFAKDSPEHVRLAIPKVTDSFNANKWQKNITVEIANEKDFISQVKSADIVYFHGGISLKLLEALRKYPTLEGSLAGKIVAGESAGANVLCKFFYSPHADSVSEGLGILPIKIISHYKKEYEGKLDNVGLDLEEVLLPEYLSKVFYK